MTEFNPYAAPKSKLVSDSPANNNVWRYKRYLVMTHDAQLPDRCFKCNAQTEGNSKKFSFVYTPLYASLLLILMIFISFVLPSLIPNNYISWAYIPIIIMFVVFIISNLLITRRKKVDIGVCNKHSLIIGGIKISIFLLILAGFFTINNHLIRNYDSLSIGLFIAAVFLAILHSFLYNIKAKKIDDEYLYLKGFSKNYLKDLPDFKPNSK